MVLACVGLTACGGGSSDSTDLSDSPYVGEWVSTGMSMGDETEDFGYEVTLTLNADGTGVLTGDGESSEFTWIPTEDGFKTEGDVNTKFKADGDNAITAKVIENYFISQEVGKYAGKIEEGHSLGASMRESGVMPDILIDMRGRKLKAVVQKPPFRK